MWVIKFKEKIVARQEAEHSQRIVSLIQERVPLAVFMERQSVVLSSMFNWMRGRVFPRGRIGADELLAQLGLKEYNSLEIAIITKAELLGVDYFTVENLSEEVIVANIEKYKDTALQDL